MEEHSPNAYLETDIWRWLLFESEFSRRRAREIILQGAQSNALSLFWKAGPDIFAQQLSLTADEFRIIRSAQAKWPQLVAKFKDERERGLITVRLNQPEYPPSLIRFLPAERRPLLLFLRGENTLLELPKILPVADTTPEAHTLMWMQEALIELATEGSLPLLVARTGYDAQLAKVLLKMEMPFGLAVPYGLGAYTPPDRLKQAMEQGRVLLISPFQPEWHLLASVQHNPILSHAVDFARALADAWLVGTTSVPQHHKEQPCFCRDKCSDDKYCHQYKTAENCYRLLVERTAPLPPGVTSELESGSGRELPPLTPEEILSTLSQGGRVPPALVARLKKSNSA